jgi:DNA polymerase III epsilon subunit-like protein
MVMYLMFDTETTGLPASWKAPVSDVDSWPRVVQLAWEAFDSRGRKTGSWSSVIRPDGFEIPRDAEKIHGISTRMAVRSGISVRKAHDKFVEALDEAAVVVAHNYSFDANVLGAEFYRLGTRHPFRGKIEICTMESATTFCAIPGRYGLKWPRLEELHFKLFGKHLKAAHDAAADVATCSKCFFELKRLRVIRISGFA